MIKILSVKTRRPDSTRDAFRRHYEDRHVPLGLGFIAHFRWRKYVRNHVLAVESGALDCDCLTEFWVASPEDQAATRAFAATPAFRALDEDDLRFLDVSRRFSCELDEAFVAGERPALDPPGTRRRAALFERPATLSPAEFAGVIGAEVGRLAGELPAGARLTLDRRIESGAPDEPRPGAYAAIVSTWAAPGKTPPAIAWMGEPSPVAVALLDVVETPSTALHRAA